MFPGAVDGRARAVLLTLGGAERLAGFYLAGGAAAALHYGHRLSHDLDLFTPEPFSPEAMAGELRHLGRFELDRTAAGTAAGTLDGIRLTLLHFPYPLLDEPVQVEGVRVAQPRDLGAMKLSAIAQRGARRDFIDLYWILTRSHPLDELLAAYTRKFGASERAIPHLLRSLAWFDDAEAEPMPRLLVAADWDEIKRRLAAEAERVGRLLF